jgi:hypothetical protein
MRDVHCAHCGTEIHWGLAKFDTVCGPVHLHTHCVRSYKAEHPGFNSNKHVTITFISPAPAAYEPAPEAAPVGPRCACCNYPMLSHDRFYVRGSYVHGGCAGTYRVRMERASYRAYQEERAEQERGAAAGAALAGLLISIFK